MSDETPAPEPIPAPTPEPAAEAAAPEAPAPAPAPEMSPAACGAKLAELFPALFAGPPKPIKLRIQADLQARAPGVFGKRVLGLFLSRHTTSTAYLKALVAAATRFDLDGQPAGEIAAEHRSAAEAELARRREIVEAKRAAEREAARAARAKERAEARPPQAPRPDAPARPPRPPRPDRPPRPPRPEGAADRPPRGDRPPRVDRPPRPPRQDRPEHRDRPEQPPRAAAPEPRVPQDPAQRERALLLRQFETSTLTKANFCALKRLSEADLDAQLAQARAEREAFRRP